MEKTRALSIIKFNKLVPGDISRQILSHIISNKEIDKEITQNFISKEEIKNLKNLYQQKKLSLTENDTVIPKYLPFYYIIKEKFPTVEWEIKYDVANKPLVNFYSPRVKNLRPSLLSLLLQKVDNNTTLLNQNYICAQKLPKVAEIALANFMESAEVILPDEEEMLRIVNWLLKSLKTNVSTIFIPLCPDYAVEPTGDPQCPFRHTFASVGSGIGQIGKRILEILPFLEKMFISLNFRPIIIAVIADFEAFSEENLMRVNLSREEFLKRVHCSLATFKAVSSMEVETAAFTTLCGGKENWLKRLEEMKEAFFIGNLEDKINIRTLINIVKNRKALYSRWHGKKSSLKEYIPIVLNQGAEYAVMGDFIGNLFKNCLILGADNNVMGVFYNFSNPIPKIYLKKYYC